VQAAARKYFTPQNRTIATLAPKLEAKTTSGGER